MNDFLAGAFGGVAALIVGYPLDTTKTKIQLAETSVSGSTLNQLRAISRQGLSSGFFRGLSIPIVSYGIISSAYFGIYGAILRQFDETNDPRTPKYLHIGIASGAAAGLCLVIATPVDVIKVTLQSQVGQKGARRYFQGPVDCVRTIVNTRGLKGLYKGLSSLLPRDVLGGAAYMPLFTLFNGILTKQWEQYDKHGLLANILAGGTVGAVTYTITMPFDVVKSRLQADTYREKYSGVVDCVVKSYQKEGYRAFFRGLTVTLVRSIPVNATMLLVYSQSLKYMNQLSLKDKS